MTSIEPPKEHKSFRTALRVSIALLFIGVLPLPFAYYQLLRLVVFLTSLWGASTVSHSGAKKVFYAAAFLWNPLIPVELLKSVWIVFDILAGAAFLFIDRKLPDLSKEQAIQGPLPGGSSQVEQEDVSVQEQISSDSDFVSQTENPASSTEEDSAPDTRVLDEPPRSDGSRVKLERGKKQRRKKASTNYVATSIILLSTALLVFVIATVESSRDKSHRVGNRVASSQQETSQPPTISTPVQQPTRPYPSRPQPASGGDSAVISGRSSDQGEVTGSNQKENQHSEPEIKGGESALKGRISAFMAERKCFSKASAESDILIAFSVSQGGKAKRITFLDQRPGRCLRRALIDAIEEHTFEAALVSGLREEYPMTLRVTVSSLEVSVSKEG